MNWVLGQTYTRDEIHEALGGSKQTFFPWKSGIVVAACLRPSLNPDAPLVVLPGHGAEKQRTADWLSANPNHVIPVFLKRDVNKWEYAGRFRCKGWSNDPAEIRKWKPANRPDPIYCVLFLEKVE
jgi:Domain of unknown function (DUF6697)